MGTRKAPERSTKKTSYKVPRCAGKPPQEESYTLVREIEKAALETVSDYFDFAFTKRSFYCRSVLVGSRSSSLHGNDTIAYLKLVNLHAFRSIIWHDSRPIHNYDTNLIVVCFEFEGVRTGETPEFGFAWHGMSGVTPGSKGANRWPVLQAKHFLVKL